MNNVKHWQIVLAFLGMVLLFNFLPDFVDLTFNQEIASNIGEVE